MGGWWGRVWGRKRGAHVATAARAPGTTGAGMETARSGLDAGPAASGGDRAAPVRVPNGAHGTRVAGPTPFAGPAGTARAGPTPSAGTARAGPTPFAGPIGRTSSAAGTGRARPAPSAVELAAARRPAPSR